MGLGAVVGQAAPAHAQVATPGASDPAGAATDAEATVTRLRAEADALSARYFDALAKVVDLDRRVADLETRIPALVDEEVRLRGLTQARAVVAYKRAGNALGVLIGAQNATAAARRARWLDLLNQRDDVAAADLRDASAKLTAQRSELRTARDTQVSALDDVKAQGKAIDALLVDAEAQRRAANAAAAAAVAATAPTTAPTTTPAPTLKPAATTPPTTAPSKPVPPTAPPSYTPTLGVHPNHDDPFLVCTRSRESSGNYAAFNPAGPYMGAYQFLQATWNSAAGHAGRLELVNVPPSTASPYDQDDVAWTLYQWQGTRPWAGLCA
jgi:hypothetical protein